MNKLLLPFIDHLLHTWYLVYYTFQPYNNHEGQFGGGEVNLNLR